MRTVLFGQYLLESGLISVDQLNRALDYQKNSNKVIGEIAMEEGLLTRQEVLEICEWQLCEDKDFGQVAVEMGFLEEREREKLLGLQRERHIYLGDALVSIGAFDKQTLDKEVEEFDKCRVDEELPETGEELESDVALSFLTLVVKLLPRLTRGRVISGGFYPTISFPDYDNIYSQRLEGDLEFEAALMLPDDLAEKIAGAMDGGKKTAAGKNRLGELITSALEVFVMARESDMPNLAVVGTPKKIGREELQARRGKAVKTVCAEYFLIRPPAPKGDFLQFNVLLMFNR